MFLPWGTGPLLFQDEQQARYLVLSLPCCDFRDCTKCLSNVPMPALIYFLSLGNYLGSKIYAKVKFVSVT